MVAEQNSTRIQVHIPSTVARQRSSIDINHDFGAELELPVLRVSDYSYSDLAASLFELDQEPA